MESKKYEVTFNGVKVGQASEELLEDFVSVAYNVEENEVKEVIIKGAEDFEKELLDELSKARNVLTTGIHPVSKQAMSDEDKNAVTQYIAELEALHEGFRKALLPKSEDPQPETNTPEDTKPEDTKPEDTKPEDTKLPVYDYLGKVCDHFTQPEVANREDAKRYEEVFEGDGENAKLVGFRKLPRFVFYVGAAPGQVAIEGCENEAEAFEELKNVKLGTYITRKDVGLITAD